MSKKDLIKQLYSKEDKVAAVNDKKLLQQKEKELAGLPEPEGPKTKKRGRPAKVKETNPVLVDLKPIDIENSQKVDTNENAYQKYQEGVTLDLIHRQQKQAVNNSGAKCLDDIFKERKNPFARWATEKDYLNYIQNLNIFDLQRQVAELGIKPSDQKPILIDKLMKEYQLKTSPYSDPGFQMPIQANRKPISPEVLAILAEGRPKR